MKERLKILRKDILKMEQKEFADKIGLKASSYSCLERGQNPICDRHIKPICNVYNVNERWLRFGEEPIFNEEDDVIRMWKELTLEDKEMLKPIIKKCYDTKP